MNTMTIQHRNWKLPMSVEDLLKLKFHSYDPKEIHDTIFDVNVGKTLFRLFCNDRDPDEVLRYAVAAIHVFHSVLWTNSAQLARKYVTLEFHDVCTISFSANHRTDKVSVVTDIGSHMSIELTSPRDWKKQGLGWLLKQPSVGQVSAMIEYLGSHSIGPGRMPVQIGTYTSWNDALEYAGLQLDDGWGHD